MPSLQTKDDSSAFSSLSYIPADAIFELTKLYNADASEIKVNLGQGTYKDNQGQPWILPAVVKAKEIIRGSNHEYLPILGLPEFRRRSAELVLGPDSPELLEGKVRFLHGLGSSTMRLT